MLHKVTEKKVNAKTNWDIKGWQFLIAISFVSLVIIIFMLLLLNPQHTANDSSIYVTTDDSKYCYALGCQNPLMKVLHYFSDSSSCGKPVYQGCYQNK